MADHTSFFDDVTTFHQVFKLPVGTVPEFTDVEDQMLRLRLIEEEWIELGDAHTAHNIVDVADACADIIYVVCGMAVSYGIPLNEVWAEVQRTNMAKAGPSGIPTYRDDGKVLKPEGWQPPDIATIIENYRRRAEGLDSDA